MTGIALELVLFLFAAAFWAGFIDSIAGGEGLIAIPALLLAGLPPPETLGTAKLQALFGSVSAAYAYGRNGHVRMRTVLPMSCLSLVGAILGASLATILPLLLIFIAIYFGLKSDLEGVHRR